MKLKFQNLNLLRNRKAKVAAVFGDGQQIGEIRTNGKTGFDERFAFFGQEGNHPANEMDWWQDPADVAWMTECNIGNVA